VTDRIYTGRTADTLANGRPLGFGDEVQLTSEEEKANQQLIDRGTCLVEKPRPRPGRRPTSDPPGDHRHHDRRAQAARPADRTLASGCPSG
jgi:hypothetical protein